MAKKIHIPNPFGNKASFGLVTRFGITGGRNYMSK